MEIIRQNGKPEDEIKKHLLLPSTDKRLGSCFNIKDEIKIKRNLDVTYYGKCPEDDCRDDYIGETKRKIPEAINIKKPHLVS